LICQEMRKRRKVVLSGDGGDEVLGGYTRYARAQWIATLARLNGALPLFRPIARLGERSLGRYGQAAKAWRFAQMSAVERMCALQTFFTEEERDAMYQPEIRHMIAPYGPTSERLRRFVPTESNDSLEQLISTEMGLRLHSDYLRKVDVASSAHGLEVRVPFLDFRMLNLAAELPSKFKISARGTSCAALRILVALPANRPPQGRTPCGPFHFRSRFRSGSLRTARKQSPSKATK
jgi:asparagine synthase (glutamine-hydrolysing)